MDRLWSPWRSNYIESFNHEKRAGNCIFCDAVSQNLSSDNSLKVFDNKTCFALLNLYPYNSGHLMVVPKKHFSDIHQLSEDETAEIMATIKLSMKALDYVMKPQGFNVGANLGKAAGAGIEDHIHFHVVPRWNGDTNFFPVIGDVKIISQDLLQTKRNLVDAFNKIIQEENK
ncbi:MAG: HIT domain-containing protein [Bacteroidota bacterium]|jgi:ATP adenylyltransferase